MFMILSAKCFPLCMYYVLIALRSLEKGFNLSGMLLITGFIYFVWSFSFLGNDVCVVGKIFEISPCF